MDCSQPGSSVPGIFQARVLEWVAIAFHIMDWILFIYTYLGTGLQLYVYIYEYFIASYCKPSVDGARRWK